MDSNVSKLIGNIPLLTSLEMPPFSRNVFLVVYHFLSFPAERSGYFAIRIYSPSWLSFGLAGLFGNQW
jgi:hypothetical protein